MLTPEQRAAISAGEPDDCSLIELEQPDNWQTGADKVELSMRGKAREAGIRLPYERKVAHATKVLRSAFQRNVTWAISYSGGKDSSVLSHLYEQLHTFQPDIFPTVPHIFSNTRMEYPETMKTVRARFSQLSASGLPTHTALPDARPASLWSDIGVPLFSKEIASKYRQWFKTGNDNHLKRVPAYLHDKFHALRDAGIMVTDKCCDELKKKPMRKLDRSLGITGHITGTRCSESQARKLMWLQRGSLYNSTRNRMWLCHPLAFWTASDVDRYLKENDITVHTPLTATGRSGCVTCLFGCHLTETNALQELHKMNPKLHEAALSWGYKEACDVAGIPTHSEPEETTP